MADNLFSTPVQQEARPSGGAPSGGVRLTVPDYSVCDFSVLDHILAFFKGFAAGAVVLFIFYKIPILSVIGGIPVGIVTIFTSRKEAVRKRRVKLRLQFYDLLEAMSVAMRAGNPMLKALMSAREDLVLIYTEKGDIVREIDVIISKFNNAVPMSEAFADLAKRSGLEDIQNFASIYATIEGKSSRADEIVRETQQIIADKMEIEMEIDTLMTAAKNEVNIMLFMPLVILLVISYAGSGFMDAIYTTGMGRGVATMGLVVFVISYIMAKAFSNVKI